MFYFRQDQLLNHIKTHDNPKNIQCLDSLDSEVFFENAELVYTEPDINVMDHLELKQEPENESNDEHDFDTAECDDSHSPIHSPLVNKSNSVELNNSDDSSDVEFSPYKQKTRKKKKTKQVQPKVPGRKRGRPRKYIPEDATEKPVDEISDQNLNNFVIKEEDGEIEIKTENDDSVIYY